MSRQKILMCPPDHFDVDYVINPWMEGNRGNADRALAMRQWTYLRDEIAKKAEVTLIDAQPGLPDEVFTANAGIVLGQKAVVSRFRAPERQGEEPFFHDWFLLNGFALDAWPATLSFEGAGDALFDRGSEVLWAGFGFRSDFEAASRLQSFFGRRTIPLHLIDPRFYHLDTCFCPLDRGYLLYFPEAFDEPSQKAIQDVVPVEKRIIAGTPDAEAFCCNAVELDGSIFMNHASPDLQKRLKDAGFSTTITPLGEFMKAGGAAKCLTLKLIEA